MTAQLTTTDPLNVISNYLDGDTNRRAAVTINILALRVQFVRDSLKTTTGDGHFDLSSESDYIIDRPPHDKTYFEHQLLALTNYFSSVSKGKLQLDYQVYPPANDAAYQMTHNMVYYSGEEDAERQQQRWAELLRDALQAARTNAPDFSRFDAFIVFHAGVGNDFAFDFNDTPFDIQSAFIDFETLKQTIGDGDPNFPGIDTGDNFYVREGIILPEQQCQKDINLGLLGTATLLMGSQLGMPSLFNTQNGRPGIGMWGLMDQGSYNYFGLIPAQPCAWIKLYMGWEEAVTVHTLEQAFIGTAQTTSAPHLIKVPISATEYFLLENRQEDWNGDGLTFGRDEYGRRAQFDSVGTIAIEEGLRVITSVDEYDYGLPGSGILIWHIDEKVIRENLASNTINDDPDHRGVDLVECDGPQDIGQQYAMFTPGYGTEAGDYWDPFWPGNVSHQYINGDRPVSLTPVSIPNSHGYGRTLTHIEFTNFSDQDTVMSCRIGNEWRQSGFPQYTGGQFGEGALNKIVLADGEVGIIAVAKSGAILGWKKDGARIIDNDESVTLQDELGTVAVYPLGLMASVGDSVLLAPAVFDFNGDGDEDVVIVDESGILTVWATRDNDADGRADLLHRADFGERITTSPDRANIVGTEQGNCISYAVQPDGSVQIIDKINLAAEPLTAFHGRANAFATRSGSVYLLRTRQGGAGYEVTGPVRAFGFGDKYYIASSQSHLMHPDVVENGLLLILSNDGYFTLMDFLGNIINNETRISTSPLASAPALGDIDLDGIPELIVASEGDISAYELRGGVPVLNFPVKIENRVHDDQLAAPVCFQALQNSQKWPHAIVGTSAGTLLAIDSRGQIIDGFPLTTGAAINSSPLLMTADQSDDNVLLFAASADGFIYGWNLHRRHAGDLEWARFGRDGENSFANWDSFEPANPSSEIMPKSRVFCYPNPSEDGRTIIRYTLNNVVDAVNIRIYDIAGELVRQFDHGMTLPGDHEMTWDVSTVQSGAYFARVEAQASSGNVVQFIKIAVVK
ncbi:T9SS type A sorting domain-containing protein [candidate division KSB1 bacterium]|nr:T9SS type A sorting domain-containing protein [candidate division KSB1 bacterium]